MQLAQPERPVVCVLGEGSAQYAIQAFWTAAAYDVPVTFLVMRNEEYAILKWFGEMEQVTGAPGLDLPALDVAAVAEGYGVPSVRVADRDGAHRGAARRHRRGRPAAGRGARGARDGVLAGPARAGPRERAAQPLRAAFVLPAACLRRLASSLATSASSRSSSASAFVSSCSRRSLRSRS